MKKIFTIMTVVFFALSFGIAYAGGIRNGITDFSGKSNDRFELAPAATTGSGAYENSAAGSKRQEEASMTEGPAVSSVRAYDTFELPRPASNSRVAQGSAAGSLRRNYAGKQSSVRAYDLFEIGR